MLCASHPRIEEGLRRAQPLFDSFRVQQLCQTKGSLLKHLRNLLLVANVRGSTRSGAEPRVWRLSFRDNHLALLEACGA